MYLSLMCSSQTWCRAAVWNGLGVESVRRLESRGLCCSLGPGLYLLEASPRSCSPHSSSKLWFGVGGVFLQGNAPRCPPPQECPPNTCVTLVPLICTPIKSTVARPTPAGRMLIASSELWSGLHPRPSGLFLHS